MLLNKRQRFIPFLIFMFSSCASGVNSETQVSNLPAASEIVSILQAQQIKQVCLFDADHQMLNALENTGIKVMIVVPDDQVLLIGKSQVGAAEWIDKNIAPFIPSTKITYIAIANTDVLVSAMQALQSALLAASLDSQVEVISSKAIDMKSWPIISPNKTLYSSWYHGNVGKMERKLASDVQFCVANSSANSNALKQGLDWACGQGGANCSAVQPGQPCYEADNLVAIASYAYNDYYQKTRANGGTCDFNSTAMLVSNDPSHGSCIFASSLQPNTNTSGGNISMPPPPFSLQPSPYDNMGNGLPSLQAFLSTRLVPLVPIFWFYM